MNPNPHNDVWLDALLAQGAEPVRDDGFSACVMQRVDALAAAAAVAAPAACLPPAAALQRLSLAMRRDRRRQFWNTAGVLAATAIGLLTLWAQPQPSTAIALVLASVALPWLLLRDPRF